MPDLSGVDVLRAAKALDRDILGIMMTAFASTDTAVEAMRLGACDYLSKPFDVDLLRMKVREKIDNRQLRQQNLLLKRTLGLTHQFANIIGRSQIMLDVIRVIAATNQDLSKRVADGRFREDLFYRINVIGIHLPPLRDRREDIPLLAEHFLTKYGEQMEKRVSGISHDAMQLLKQYDWPGN